MELDLGSAPAPGHCQGAPRQLSARCARGLRGPRSSIPAAWQAAAVSCSPRRGSRLAASICYSWRSFLQISVEDALRHRRQDEPRWRCLNRSLAARGVPAVYWPRGNRESRQLLPAHDEVKIVRLDTTIASFLHDTREDTRLSADQIEDCFGSEVCNIVKVLSKVPKEGYLDRFYTCTDWRPYFVKACDRLDNLRSLSQSSLEFRKKQVTETRDKYFRLFDRMVGLAPEVYRDGTRRLRDLIQDTTTAVPLTDESAHAS